MRVVLLVATLGSAAFALSPLSTATEPQPFRAELLSADFTRAVVIHVWLHGSTFALGASRAPGRVLLAGDTGSVTTPAVLQMGEQPGEIVLETSVSDPELVVHAAGMAGGAPDVFARGHSVTVARDTLGRVRVVAPAIRSIQR